MVDFSFYVNSYHGSAIEEKDWPALEREASAKLRQYKKTFTVSASDEDAEAMAVCAMAESIDYFNAALNGTTAVQSASIGSVSVSYGNPLQSADLSAKGREKELYRCACLYLDIYRGVS